MMTPKIYSDKIYNNLVPKKMTNEAFELAIHIMEIILHDNGMMGRFDPDKPKIKQSDIQEIGGKASILFTKYPELLTDDNLEEMCIGDEDEAFERWGQFSEYNDLKKCLDNWFEKI